MTLRDRIGKIEVVECSNYSCALRNGIILFAITMQRHCTTLLNISVEMMVFVVQKIINVVNSKVYCFSIFLGKKKCA